MAEMLSLGLLRKGASLMRVYTPGRHTCPGLMLSKQPDPSARLPHPFPKYCSHCHPLQIGALYNRLDAAV